VLCSDSPCQGNKINNNNVTEQKQLCLGELFLSQVTVEETFNKWYQLMFCLVPNVAPPLTCKYIVFCSASSRRAVDWGVFECMQKDLDSSRLTGPRIIRITENVGLHALRKLRI
jgi:hypothetical protein